MPIQDVATDDEMGVVLRNHDTVVLDFWAEWCPPCKGFAPVFAAAADQFDDMAFCRVNTEVAADLKEAFEVKSIPTLLVVREGVLVASQAGYMSKKVLFDLLQDVRTLDMAEVRHGAPPT